MAGVDVTSPDFGTSPPNNNNNNRDNIMKQREEDMRKLWNFKDEFDEFRARANSGGSLYGLLRRQGFISDHEAVARGRSRQRSKSLVPPTSGKHSRLLSPSRKPKEPVPIDPIAEEAMKTQRYQRRRFTAACVDAAHLISRKDIQVSISPPPSTPSADASPWSNYQHPEIPESYRDDTEDSSSEHTFSALDPADLLKPPDAVPNLNRIIEEPNLYRRRSFSVSPRGSIIHEGDFLVSKLDNSLVPVSSVGSDLDSYIGTSLNRSRASSFNSQGSAAVSVGSFDTPLHRILMLGRTGSGKTALAQQFLTSECMCAQNTSFDDGVECTVTVLLDGQESIMDFLDSPDTGELDIWKRFEVDGFVVVYSVIDRSSFETAVDLLYDIRKVECNNAAVILVGNKSDLVRARVVSEEEGKTAAETYDCKYIEVSAVLNHKVDDLLVGLLKQIRLNPERIKKKKEKSKIKEVAEDTAGCLQRARQNMLGKILRVPRGISKSCENLLTL